MKKVLISTVLAVGLLAGNAAAMECVPGEVPVKLKVDNVDPAGIVVNGSLGCAQSATLDGKIRVLVTRLNFTESGGPTSTVIMVNALPSEIVGR